MNKKNLDKIIEQYIANFDYLNKSEEEGGTDEGYKWRVISSFKKHWDIDAIDFSAMLQESMADIAKTNLINNSTVQPVTGLINLSKIEGKAEFLREEFRKLFAEDDGNLDARGERVDAFMETINTQVEKYFNGSWKSKQPRNAVIFYLNLWRPEDNYLFKATEAKEWADCIEFADDFGSGSNFSLKKYYKMCDDLRESLSNYPDLLELNKVRVEKEAKGFDDDNHILAFDIIYCSHYMSFYKECPTLGVSTKERIRIASRREQEEKIDNDIIEKKNEIENLEKKIKPVPDLTGHTVNHKLLGEGKVIGYSGRNLIIRFESKESKFSPDFILKGVIKVLDIDDTVFKDNDKIIKEIQLVNKSIESLLREKDRLT